MNVYAMSKQHAISMQFICNIYIYIYIYICIYIYIGAMCVQYLCNIYAIYIYIYIYTQYLCNICTTYLKIDFGRPPIGFSGLSGLAALAD